MSLKFAVFAATLLLGTCAASATTISFNITANGASVLNSAGFYQVTSNTFSQFDTSLGNLNSVTIALSGTATYTGNGTAGLNEITTPAQLNTYLLTGSGITSSYAYMPSNFTINANGIVSDATLLAAFEGTGMQAIVLEFSISDTTSPALSTSGVTGKVTYNYLVAATPEPSSLLLLGTGVVGLAGIRWRHKAA